jgi:hypothetical protein
MVRARLQPLQQLLAILLLLIVSEDSGVVLFVPLSLCFVSAFKLNESRVAIKTKTIVCILLVFIDISLKAYLTQSTYKVSYFGAKTRIYISFL